MCYIIWNTIFVGVDDDVVKLYDLTSLADSHEDQSTPFTVPLGRLLYRVACNMIKNGNKSKKKIQLLLENCLLLLDEEKHSQVEYISWLLGKFTLLYFSWIFVIHPGLCNANYMNLRTLAMISLIIRFALKRSTKWLLILKKRIKTINPN